MKSLLTAIFFLIAFTGFSQTSELKVEEKSSDWIKIAATTSVVKPKTVARAKKKTSSKPQPPKEDVQDEFEKTNSKVNRFKKKD